MTTNVMKAFEGGKLFKHISKFTYVLLYQVISLRITNTWMMIMMIGTTTVMMSYLRVVSYSSTGQREGGREGRMTFPSKQRSPRTQPILAILANHWLTIG